MYKCICEINLWNQFYTLLDKKQPKQTIQSVNLHNSFSLRPEQGYSKNTVLKTFERPEFTTECGGNRFDPDGASADSVPTRTDKQIEFQRFKRDWLFPVWISLTTVHSKG